MTTAPVLVREVHSNSGPGWNVYACPDCAPYFPPGPDPLEVIEAARRRRAEEADRRVISRRRPGPDDPSPMTRAR
ncbi:hypothetical protein ABZW18_08690 [Streptomyces sp. NPDC004647]|uniref:hypothetical protein n=1 Tax=Streptomyces sp. NPDC004647 TaxID=3154671 RepID=UPI0033AB6FCA